MKRDFSSPGLHSYLSVLSILFVFATSGLLLAETAKPQDVPCGIAKIKAAGFNVNAGTNIQAIPSYRKAIYGLLKAEEFEQLDCLADSARSQKETFPGGFWKLHAIYDAVEEPPQHPTAKDWAAHIRLLRRWTAARPSSITARVALAEGNLDYGWDARGDGDADSVSQSGWKLLNQRTAQAAEELKQASQLPVKCPEWYVAMQRVALARSWSPRAMRELFEEAVKFEPAYYYYYNMYANSILPKWGGAQGQVEDFLQKAADGIGGSSGDILYFQTAANLYCCATSDQLKLSWPRIQRGFRALEERNGSSPENWNRLARIAAAYGDVVTANEMMSRIGEQWSEYVWNNYSYFESVREWAKQGEVAKYTYSVQEESADDNLHTPGGLQYEAMVREKIDALVPGCVKAFGTDSRKYEIVFKITQQGTVTEVSTNGLNHVGFCLQSRIMQPGRGLTPFPTPPKPDFWIRYDLDLH
jgi:hypothetical protein